MRAVNLGPDREWGRDRCAWRSRTGAAMGIVFAVWLGLASAAQAAPLWTVDGSIGVPFDPPRRVAPLPPPADPVPEFVAWLDHYYAPPVVEPGPGKPARSGQFRAKPDSDHVIAPLDAKSLARKFDGIGYRLAAVRGGQAHVPRLFVHEMPRDMRALESADLRKRLFIRTMLPLILRANEEVRRERTQLLEIARHLEHGQPLSPADGRFLEQMRALYADDDCTVDELLRRVDIVPPSLALAQAAEESGWGTSRFVREGNAVFGQRTFTGGGLVPLRRDRDKSHRVRSFSHVQASVAAYVFNLNTHPAYDRFRKLRARMRAEGEELDSGKLVATLDRYSERGNAYVATIRSILRANALDQLDDVKLSPHNRELPGRGYTIETVRWSF